MSIVFLLSSCSSSRHVAKGDYLLDEVNIKVNNADGNISTKEMSLYLKQQPNRKMLWSMKFRLGIYNLSGNDSTKWYNRWLKSLGEAPVIYDPSLAEASIDQLQRALINKGYLKAKVNLEEKINEDKKKIRLNYILEPGYPHIIDSIFYIFPDSIFSKLVMKEKSKFVVKEGSSLDRSELDAQRDIITNILKDNGYYGFTKEYITFNADTTFGSNLVNLTMTLNKPYSNSIISSHEPYKIGKVYYITDYDPSSELSLNEIINGSRQRDYKGLIICDPNKSYLRDGILRDNCYIYSGELYNQANVDMTYRALSRLSILKFISIRFVPIEDTEASKNILNAYILLTPGKSQSFSVELEGTNSEGDLGVAVGGTYSHRNIGKGSETLSLKIRGAYESLSGDFEDIIHDRYMEYSVETGLEIPKFKVPFLSDNFKRRIDGSTDVNLSLSYQERPEYTRVISTAGWSYRWRDNPNNNRYIFTPIDINYVYLPESTNDFIDLIAPDNPLLKYSYEDHFIMRMGFSYYHTNKKNPTPWDLSRQSTIYTIRGNAEIAGNLLYLINEIINPRGHVSENPYKIFGIYYSQYFKIYGDFSLLHVLDSRNSLAFHVGLGLGYPYGNSTILPFEKRFYGGGANGVRGWDVRTLGPGSYPNTNSVTDFINQCGDIRLIMNLELRTKLFWVIELATFIDAGNIWTIHNYPNQPGGMFHFNSFYKQLAGSYGLGFRFDFSYFLLRFDLGMKAHNPAMGTIAWPLVHPDWHRDSSFHFSIGYPF